MFSEATDVQREAWHLVYHFCVSQVICFTVVAPGFGKKSIIKLFAQTKGHGSFQCKEGFVLLKKV